MFELTQDNTQKPLLATVRYVRRQWAYDNRGTVDLSTKVIERASVDMSWIPSEQQGARSPGFHRLDATFVGEMEFEYRGGDITMLSRRAEEAVRPWKDLKGNQ